MEKAHSIMSDIIEKVMNRNTFEDTTSRADSEFRSTNNVPKNEAPSIYLEVNRNENPTNDEAWIPSAAYSVDNSKDTGAMKSGQNPNTINDESSAAGRSTVTHVKGEDMEEYADTIELDREVRMINIEVLHYEIKGRFLQPNREMSDTKAQLSGNLHPTSIDRREEDESKKEMVNNAERKLEGSDSNNGEPRLRHILR